MKQEKMPRPLRALQTLEAERRKNLRQLLLRASRMVNIHVVEGLHARGYARLRSTHTTLLSNLPLAGASVTEVAERAGITKQAMGRLASELEQAGYLKQEEYAGDGRVRMLRLTSKGAQLMLDSFEIMAALQKRYAKATGAGDMDAVIRGLTAIIGLEDISRKAGAVDSLSHRGMRRPGTRHVCQ